MNKKSKYLIITVTLVFTLFFVEIFYLYTHNTLDKNEFLMKKDFIKMTIISNLNLAIKNNDIKTLP